MQQKFLEEQIGAHRKSKKALSAKQRTAKKAGREFPEEDAEQLKHVTEQQGVVQKQLEQVKHTHNINHSWAALFTDNVSGFSFWKLKPIKTLFSL